jgi:hypothetical protein
LSDITKTSTPLLTVFQTVHLLYIRDAHGNPTLNTGRVERHQLSIGWYLSFPEILPTSEDWLEGGKRNWDRVIEKLLYLLSLSLKKKNWISLRLWTWLKWYSACITRVRP